MTKRIRIALDDGHGMATNGKRTPTLPDGQKSAETGKVFMHENEFNRAVVKYAKEHLERCGFEVLLVAPTDADTTLEARVKSANNWNANLYVSVHANANTGKWGSWGGIETFTWSSGESLRIGKIVHKWLLKGTQLRDRGVKNGNHLYVIRNTKMPAILIEGGFMDSLTDYAHLLKDSYRRETAQELAQGICEAYGIKYIPEPTKQPTSNATSQKTMYRVVTGSYENRKTAEAQIEKLKKNGFDSFLLPHEKMFRVVTGSFTQKAQATKRMNELKAKGHDSFIAIYNS